MLLGNAWSSTLIVLEQSSNGTTPFNEVEGKLLFNIFNLFNTDLLTLAITALITDNNIKPNKTNLYKLCYPEFHKEVVNSQFYKVVLFTGLLDKFIEDNIIALPLPSEVTKKKYSRVLSFPCCKCPSLIQLLADTKLESSGKKHEVYQTLKSFL